MPSGANTYGGKDSWDDYDNTNTMVPKGKLNLTYSPPKPKSLVKPPRIKTGENGNDSGSDDDEATPAGLSVEGTGGEGVKMTYRKKIPF